MASVNIRDWLALLASSGSALAAITALWISLWVANVQRQIQTKQLKQDLFEKRYAIFLAAEAFLAHVLKTDGSVNLIGEEFRKFRYVMDEAQFLFNTDVVNYLNEINQAVLGLHGKCFERDHLASMNKQDAALGVEILQKLDEFSGPFLEKRKKIFSPYLQLGRSEVVKGGVAEMRLNGWQRLWVVLATLWLLPVLVFTYELWPTTADVSKGDIYMEMKPDDGRRLIDFYDIVATRIGGTNALNPKIVELQQDKDFLAASSKEQKAYLSDIDPDFAKASVLDQNHYFANITGLAGPSVDVDKYTVQFVPGVSQEDQDKTAGEYRASLRRILTLKKETFASEAFAFWIVPAVALYVLGLGIAWVRRGF
jgi:hypothetical protein